MFLIKKSKYVTDFLFSVAYFLIVFSSIYVRMKSDYFTQMFKRLTEAR